VARRFRLLNSNGRLLGSVTTEIDMLPGTLRLLLQGSARIVAEDAVGTGHRVVVDEGMELLRDFPRQPDQAFAENP